MPPIVLRLMGEEVALFHVTSLWNMKTSQIKSFEVRCAAKLAKKSKQFYTHWTELKGLSDVNPCLADSSPTISLALYQLSIVSQRLTQLCELA